MTALDHGTRPSVLARNNVKVLGHPDGPVVLFAHGFGCDQGMWRRVLPAFLADHRVVVFDLVGAGASDLSAYEPAKYASLDGYAADVVEICDELGLRDVTLVAHSVSAMVAVVASVRRPDLFAGLALVAPSPCYIDDPADGYVGGFSRRDIDDLLASLDSNYFAWAAAIAPMVMGTDNDAGLGDELAGSFCRTDPDIAAAFARVTFLSDCRPLLGQVRTPALILQCAEDMLAPPVVGRYMHARMTGSTLVDMVATGHCPHVSAPDETAAAVRRFMAGTATS